jgi:hypothetical protein
MRQISREIKTVLTSDGATFKLFCSSFFQGAPGIKRGKYKARRTKDEIDAEKILRRKRLKYELNEKKFICKFPDCKAADSRLMFENRTDFEAHFLEMHMKQEDRVIPCSVVS